MAFSWVVSLRSRNSICSRKAAGLDVRRDASLWGPWAKPLTCNCFILAVMLIYIQIWEQVLHLPCKILRLVAGLALQPPEKAVLIELVWCWGITCGTSFSSLRGPVGWWWRQRSVISTRPSPLVSLVFRKAVYSFCYTYPGQKSSRCFAGYRQKKCPETVAEFSVHTLGGGGAAVEAKCCEIGMSVKALVSQHKCHNTSVTEQICCQHLLRFTATATQLGTAGQAPVCSRSGRRALGCGLAARDWRREEAPSRPGLMMWDGDEWWRAPPMPCQSAWLSGGMEACHDSGVRSSPWADVSAAVLPNDTFAKWPAACPDEMTPQPVLGSMWQDAESFPVRADTMPSSASPSPPLLISYCSSQDRGLSLDNYRG